MIKQEFDKVKVERNNLEYILTVEKRKQQIEDLVGKCIKFTNSYVYVKNVELYDNAFELGGLYFSWLEEDTYIDTTWWQEFDILENITVVSADEFLNNYNIVMKKTNKLFMEI